jgi:lipopolysaccharide export system protein LptA
MRTCFLLIGFAAVSAFATAQTASAPMDFVAKANSVRRVNVSEMELRGDVELRVGGAVIRADAIDSLRRPDGTVELELRGNVHVTMPSGR